MLAFGWRVYSATQGMKLRPRGLAIGVRREKTKRGEHLTLEQTREAEVLRAAIKAAIKQLDLPTLRALLRVVRYRGEGKTPAAMTREGLQDEFQRRINLDVYVGQEDGKE